MGAAGADAAALAAVSMGSILHHAAGSLPKVERTTGFGTNLTKEGHLNDTSFTPLSAFNEDDPDLDRISKKTLAVLVLLMAGVLVGVIINFVNLHTDFQDLQDFYRGYMGRRMLISEGKLTSRDYINAIKEVNEKKKKSCKPSKKSRKSKNLANGQAGGSQDLQKIQDEMHQLNPHCHSNFAAFSSIKPFEDVEPIGHPEHLEWLQTHLPLYAADYIEDQDPEWKDLDYSIEIGKPPKELFEFIRQYDWNMYYCDKQTSDSDRQFRRNLFYQFRKWKKRRRRRWEIVVTERAKKEMAEQDHTIGSGRRK
ncbi:uncharacterized protein LOC131890364 [Tigriopus californicus]|uniref:uncharacterized protein LOC131890364 n=1 Tax=Tigriopus californicus TaxID=6832 RepID=UPI0027DA16FA|nr:uncharacterized protein LOC131890364 [Tigriopus californicus]